ncbi:SLATT domain-containing protein [Crateriforma spongiae]|uniref:SLATT domain-containing protein n=1 Tax=Crateriforma spongiae TaxID=2724528 RepID=UPI0039AFF736
MTDDSNPTDSSPSPDGQAADDRDDSTFGTVAQKYERLHDKLDKTARSRFIAARRFELHETLSLYTVVLMSCAVIALTLFDSLDMLPQESEKFSSFLQVFCAVGVLVYSVILSKSDFALKSYRHHECAMALNKIRSTVYKHTIEEPKTDQYNRAADEYAKVLDRFDNHLNLDFRMMQMQTPMYRKEYGVNWWFTLKVRVEFLFVYWHYLLFSFLAVVGPIAVYLRNAE